MISKPETELEIALSRMRYSLREMISWNVPSPLFPFLELKGPRQEFCAWWPQEKVPECFRDVVKYPGIRDQSWGHKKGVLRTAYFLWDNREKEGEEHKILLGAFLHTILTSRGVEWYYGPFAEQMRNLSMQIGYEWHHASNDALPASFTWHFHTLIRKAEDVEVVGELAAVCIAMMRGCWQLVHLAPAADGEITVEKGGA